MLCLQIKLKLGNSVLVCALYGVLPVPPQDKIQVKQQPYRAQTVRSDVAWHSLLQIREDCAGSDSRSSFTLHSVVQIADVTQDSIMFQGRVPRKTCFCARRLT